MLLLLFFACAGNMTEQWEAERDAVLAAPRPALKGWLPEVRFRFSEPALARAAGEMVAAGALSVDQPLEVPNPLGVPLRARPLATVTALDVSLEQGCAACAALDLTLDGGARWTAGPAKGQLPFTARVAGTLQFGVEEAADGWRVTGRIVEVGRIRVQAGDVMALDLSPFLGEWVGAALKDTPPLRLGTIGGDKLPFRKLRIAGDGGALELQGLTDVAGAKPVPAARQAPSDDWELRMHPDTALALMRRTAFQAGPGEMDVAIDPRALAVEGDRFTLGLRIWRLQGRGWWRDYTVTGGVGVKNGKIRLKGEEAAEAGKSPGAGWADPLALLVEKRILESVTDGVDQSVPARRKVAMDAVTLDAKAGSARGEDGDLVVTGALTVRPPDGTTPRKARQRR